MDQRIINYGVPIVVSVVVVYLVVKQSNSSTSTTSTINRLVPLSGENNTQAAQSRDAARVSAFSSLAQVAGQQISAEAQQQSEKTQLEGLMQTLTSGQEIEKIKSGLQRELGLQGLGALKMQLAGIDEANRVASADRRYDTDAQLMSIDRMASADRAMFGLQSDSALQMLKAQIAAVQSTGAEYRNQSLERAGTYLNALGSIWNQPGIYNYQSAFGGNRPPTFLQQLGTFGAQILPGLKNILAL